MEHARLSSLLVIALFSLSQTEISSTLPETWYSANVISDGDYSPKPLTDIFSTEATFSSTNPIIVLPTSTTPDPIVSTSTLPNVNFSTSTLSTSGTITEGPTTEVSVLPLSTERPAEPVPTQPPPIPTVFISTTAATPSPQPEQPPQPPQPPQLPILSVFQQPPAAPSPPPFLSTPQQIQIQTAQQSSPLPPQQIQNLPPIFIPPNQQTPQTIQNTPPPQPLPSTSLPPVTTTALPPSTTTTPLPSSSVSTEAPCATTTPVSVPQASSQFPTFRIRMVAPSGSITNVRIDANPTIPTTTTRRPTTTRTRRRNRNNYDGCVNGCGGTREPICASPLGVTPIDPDTLKGFPSVCHMACHNSFRRTLYQKVTDGKCGRLRTRIRPINENKLKRDELNKASYTIIQGGPTMLRKYFSRAVKYGVVSGVAIGGTAYAAKYDYNASTLVRITRTAVTAIDIGRTYKTMLYSKDWDTNSSEYLEVKSEAHKISAEKLLELCKANKGAYIKVGQHVGALDYLLPNEYVTTMRVLHKDAPQNSVEELYKVIKEDLNEDPNNLFSEFDTEPLGTASLAQVHRAKLKDGTEVAVKVQHHFVRKNIQIDITWMELVLKAMAKIFPEFQMQWLIDETRKNIMKELDFLQEGRNAEKVAKMFTNYSWLRVPKIFWDYSTERVLVMEYKHKIDKADLCRKLGDLYSHMIFISGFVHSDPHPGNILVRKDPGAKDVTVFLLDHGLYALWLSIIYRDREEMRVHSEALGIRKELYGLFACMCLEHVDRQALLVLKTNDLIRSIEYALHMQDRMCGFLVMSRHQDAILYHVKECILGRSVSEASVEEEAEVDVKSGATKATAKAPKDKEVKKKVEAPKVKFEMKLSGDTILASTGRLVPFETIGDRPPDLGEIIVLVSSNNLPASDDLPIVFVNIEALFGVPVDTFKKLKWHEVNKHRHYWYAQAQATLQKRLQYASEKKPVAKNVPQVVGGKSSGIVTTARITHATPAALYAHAPSRYWEDDSRVPPTVRKDCKDIAMQLVENEPGRSINVSLFEYSHMEFNAERGTATDAEEGTSSGSTVKADDPSLADMTRAALSILLKNDKGFFLLIEGGRIDHAHHYNNPYRALDETLELETALLAALERVNPAETLIVVTADHGHVMTFGGQATPRGHPVLGADTMVSDIDGLRYTTLLYGSGPGHAEPRAIPANSSITSADAVHAAAVPRQWATHGGEDVPIYALGPMATILFAGVVEQSYIPHAIAYAACLAHQSRRCQEKTNFTQPQVQLPKCVAPEVSSVAADDNRDASGGRRVVVASSVMSDERVTRSDAHKPPLNLIISVIVTFSTVQLIIN
ncbi:hypothetical protein MSG28_009634 [Choristoneura fumiferana]|uniref:Uncharacterized protein n=1 Tax=Choristoneura fumiferana TaxID=7141 RepID=A0ACC0JC09_CHOFU|nr:hypothetical protein MSG28_009634 [Choristoneura fumiferana]